MLNIAIDGGLSMACVYGIYRLALRDRISARKTFDAVVQRGINDDEKERDQFEIVKYIKKAYGFDAIVSIPNGKSFEDLEKFQPKLEAAYGGYVSLEWGRQDKSVYMRVNLEGFKERTYSPVNCKPAEFLFGYDLFGRCITVDQNKFTDVLIVGSIGSGKSRLNYLILTNLAYNYGPDVMQFYLTQLEKDDLAVFRKCRNTKFYADNLKDAYAMFMHLEKERQRRSKLFKTLIDKDIIDIKDYNNAYRTKQLPYLVVNADEYSYFMVSPNDNKEVEDLKNKCAALLESLIKAGRAAGIIVVLALQRPDFKNLPPFFKSQMNTRCSGRMINKRNSDMAIDSDDAVGLPPGEFIIVTNEQYHIKVPYIDLKLIRETLGDRILKKAEYLDIKPKNDSPFTVKEVPVGQMEKAKKEIKIMGNNKGVIGFEEFNK